MKKTAFITGITGQDGAYLADFLLRRGYRVVGLARRDGKEEAWRLDYFGIRGRIKIYRGSLLDDELIEKILRQHRPAEIYNLAGQSSAVKSWELAEETWQTNYAGVVSLLEGIRKFSPHSRFFQASSVEIYGQKPALITEKNTHFQAPNPYAVAKLAAHQSVINYREKYGLFAVNGILFNHGSPLRTMDFVTKVIARGVAEIAVGKRKKIILGNTASRRDWGYAGDFVEAMYLMLRAKTPKDYVVCTGKIHSVKDFVAETFLHSGIKNWRRYVAIDKKLFRRAEPIVIRGSSSALRRELGWRPKIGFKKLIALMMDYELEQLK